MHKGLLALSSTLLIISGGTDLTVSSEAADGNWFNESSFMAINIRSIGAFKLFSGLIALSFAGNNTKEISKSISSISDIKTWK